MARRRALVLAAGALTLVLAIPLADAQIPAAPGGAPRDEEPGRGREVVPLPPIPEHMAVPSPTEGLEAAITPSPSPEPSPTFNLKPHKHRKKKTPKPLEGVEAL